MYTVLELLILFGTVIMFLVHDSGHTLVHAGYGYVNSQRKNPPLQLSIQCSPQRTPKWPSSEPYGTTRQQAIEKTHAK
jgi:hypothetical protein